MQMYNFLQTPPSIELKEEDYTDKRGEWNADIHMIISRILLKVSLNTLLKTKKM
jgi:hypothetical protein